MTRLDRCLNALAAAVGGAVAFWFIYLYAPKPH